jgi:hypothetical protein
MIADSHGHLSAFLYPEWLLVLRDHHVRPVGMGGIASLSRMRAEPTTC